jgi:hypothetical protein
MFKTLAFMMQNNAFLRVSADTKTWTCWPPDLATLWLIDMHTEMSSSPAGGLRLPAGKHTGILIYYQTIVKEKKKKI